MIHPIICGIYHDESQQKQICIASARKFDLNEVDPNIDHDKPWGAREWAPGVEAATSSV